MSIFVGSDVLFELTFRVVGRMICKGQRRARSFGSIVSYQCQYYSTTVVKRTNGRTSPAGPADRGRLRPMARHASRLPPYHLTTRMTVNVRALATNNPPRHRCQLPAARGGCATISLPHIVHTNSNLNADDSHYRQPLHHASPPACLA
jgi:hypothetical protein